MTKNDKKWPKKTEKNRKKPDFYKSRWLKNDTFYDVGLESLFPTSDFGQNGQNIQNDNIWDNGQILSEVCRMELVIPSKMTKIDQHDKSGQTVPIAKNHRKKCS